MSTLQVPAILAILVGCAPAAVLAQPQRGEVETASITVPAPQTGPSRPSPETCPYQFDSDMPAATFCVYTGVARGDAGEECATDVVVIWSSAASQSGGPTKKTSASNRDVYLGFVAYPELVVRAIVDPRQSDRAEIVDYTLGGEETPLPLAGQMTLPAVRLGAVDVLRMELGEARQLHPGGCAFVSYSGRFVGMIGPPSQTTSSQDTFREPRR